MLHLSSTQNNQLKRLKSLQDKAKKRKLENAFVIEGKKEITHAIKGGYQMEALFFKEGSEFELTETNKPTTELFSVTPTLLERFCYRKTSSVIAIAQCKTHGFDQLIQKNDSPFILVAESPEKPGNIGALLRTADAMDVDFCVLIDPKTDLYNPNVIRSSVGCLFSVPIVTSSIKQAFDYFEQHKINVYSAALTKNAQTYTQFDYTQATAIAVGTEDKGLTSAFLDQKNTPIIIPMRGENDSLNVSVAAGIILAEVQRQRN